MFELGFIRQAIGLLLRSADAGGFPAGLLVVRDGAVLATVTKPEGGVM